jgi:peptide deformylase|tara:strand:- start:104 stop:619 length:516 start_codon:yes stop_codon:yes gene_type:complete
MKLIYYPDEFLERKVQLVDLENPKFDPKELHKEMVELMLASKGIGLSANQIELDAQVFVMGDKAGNTNICINPTVLEYTEDTVIDLEGCLSFPHMYVKISRPKEILAEFYDENLEKQTVAIDGYSAKCYLHELDHLLGITMKDRVSKLKWDMAKKKSHKFKTLYDRVNNAT